MRTHVSFRHPASFVPLSEEDGIPSVEGVGWFVSLLRRVAALEIDDDLCQEDWGVVIFASRNQRRFSIGLGVWPEHEDGWLAHFRHSSFAWLKRFSRSSQAELRRLLDDVDDALKADAQVSAIAWYRERDMTRADLAGAASPGDAPVTRRGAP